MRPKRNIVLVGIRPELRFTLGLRVQANVWEAETMADFIGLIGAKDLDHPLFVIDWRDDRELAVRALAYLCRYLPFSNPILILTAEPANEEPTGFVALRDGCDFNYRVIDRIKQLLARKRGPAKGAPAAICQC